MKESFKLSVFMSLAFIVSSCSNDDVIPSGCDYLTDAPVSITVGGVQSRAGYEAGEVITGGSISFWIDQSETQYDAKHLEISYLRGMWIPMGNLLWYNATDIATYTAVYPHKKGSHGIYDITIPTVQTEENVKATEILYATGSAKGEDGAINITFSHTLSQVKVALTKAPTMTSVVVNSVKLSNVAISGTFAAATGEWSNQTNNAEVSFIKNSDTEFEALLIPQTIGDYYITVNAVVDGIEKQYRFESTDLVLEQGATYTLPLQVGESPYVNLDLSSGTLWAICNVGATAPHEYGDCFAWGETEPIESPYGWDVYKWGNNDINLTKYCLDSNYGKNGFVDNLLALEIDDDAAWAQWGEKWRMPTEAQINELRDECTWELYTLNGVKGYRGTGKNGNTIFLPMADYYEEDGAKGTTDRTYYWSSALDDYYSPCAHALYFSAERVNILNAPIARSYGCAIRPVRSE